MFVIFETKRYNSLTVAYYMSGKLQGENNNYYYHHRLLNTTKS